MSSSGHTSPAVTASEILTTNNHTLLNINMSNIFKLTTTNYLMWSLQVHALFDGHALAGYLDGTVVIPPATITVNSEISENPDFTIWKRQDKLIYSALLGAISSTIQPLVSRATMSSEIWHTLAETYAKPSRGHIKQLKTQLKHWTKGNKSIAEYIQGVTVKIDELAILGKGFDHEDQIELILEGLPDEYKSVIDQVEGRDTPPTIPDLYERLLNHEAKLLSAIVPSLLPTTANVAQQRNNYYRQQNKPRYNNNHMPNQNWQQSQSNRPDNRGPRPYLGRCQLCGVQGHSAKRCPQLQPHQQVSLPSSSSSFTPWQPRANIAIGAPYTATNWLLDSGATHHITSDLNNLSLHQPYPGGDDVLIGDGSGLAITHKGSTSLSYNSCVLELNDVLCVPNIHKNLISVYQLCNTNKVSVEFFPQYFQVKDLSTGAQLLIGKIKDGLYEWPVSPSEPQVYSTTLTSKTSLSSWHSRLGHPSSTILNAIISSFSLPISSPSQKQLSCSDCLINKSHKLPFNQSSITSTCPLQILYTDVWTSPITSLDNFKYYLIFVDHFTRYTWFYPLKHKSQVKETFISFKALVENRFRAKITTLYSDNGGEFIALQAFLTTHGISHLTTPPHTPEHNGLSERKHRHIVETGLTLLSQASMPQEYWTFAFSTAVYLINRLPTPVLTLTSPYYKLFEAPPNYEKLRVFGCLCFPWLKPYTNHKLDARSTRCVFLGYSLTQSAYYCLDIDTSRIYTSRHVQFVESEFPFATPKSSPLLNADNELSASAPEISHIPITAPFMSSSTPPPSSILHRTSPLPHDVSPAVPPPQVLNPITLPSSSPDVGLAPTLTTTSLLPIIPTHTNTNQTPTISPNTHPPTNDHLLSLQNQNTNPISDPPENHHKMQTRAKNLITKPNPKYTLTVALLSHLEHEPTSVAQALKEEKWRRAMSDEFDSITRNQTFDLVPPKSSQNVVGCKWVFKIKTLPSGVLDRYKARLVAKGFNQQYGVDYSETFSPVIKTTTIRIVLGIAVRKSWPIHQLDVNNAFLQGTLTEEVYMSQPPGFIDTDHPNYVCRLKKAIYGLKQAPRAWYQELKKHLLQAGFTNSLADASLFIYNNGCHLLYVLIYVDDILVTGDQQSLVTNFISSLADRFSIKDPVDLNYFLGVEATRTADGLHLMQRKYIFDLLTKTNMVGAKSVTTPLPTSPKLTLNSGTVLEDGSEYRMVIGSLQYLAFTRPDIAYAVNRLSQFMHRPTSDHWQAAKRVLRYLAGTLTHGIFLKSSSPLNLHAFSDADWAGDTDDYVSTNAYVTYLGSHPISWSSKKQRGVARSSTEAEYRSLANTAAEVRWLCSLLSELSVDLPSSPVIYCDNVGATYLSANPVFHSRMKHIALDYHFIRSQIQAGALRVSHVSTHDQLADALTKPLARSHFQTACHKIGVSPVPPSYGGV